MQDLNHRELNSVRQRGGHLCILSVFTRRGDINAGGVLQGAQDAHQIGEVQHAVVVGVHLLHEHVAVGLTHHQVVVSEEHHQIECVDLETAALVDALEHVQG